MPPSVGNIAVFVYLAGDLHQTQEMQYALTADEFDDDGGDETDHGKATVPVFSSGGKSPVPGVASFGIHSIDLVV